MTLNRSGRLQTRTPLSPMSARRAKALAEQGIAHPTSTLVGRSRDPKTSKLPARPKLAVATGEFTAAVRDVIEDRDGHSCARCGIGVGDQRGWDYSLQHRRARGNGGSSLPDTGLAANGIILCGSATSPHCHHEVEQRGERDRLAGYWMKHLIDGVPVDPTTVPIKHALYGWVLLDNQGGYERTSTPVGWSA